MGEADEDKTAQQQSINEVNHHASLPALIECKQILYKIQLILLHK